MRSRIQLLSFALLLACLSSCGQSISSKFSLAAKKQAALQNRTLDLWKRGPASDLGTQVLTAQDNLETVPRTSLVLPDILDVNAPIRSADVIVYESTSNERAPSFFEWAGQLVPVANPDFQIFHTYYQISVAMTYAKKIYPDFKPQFSPLKNGGDGTYRIYAVEPGDFAQTGYDYYGKDIKFFRQNTGTDQGFNPGSEADSIYHEFGHSLMHEINAQVVTAPTKADGTVNATYYNPDLDAIQEGMADFFAAAVTRDDHILKYLAANAKYFADPQSRMGPELFREADNDLYFPAGYRNEIHMDGRLISATLTDIRKWLSREAVIQRSGCTVSASSTCQITPSTKNAMPKEAAYDAIASMSYALFSDLTISSNFADWAEILNGACSGGSFPICDQYPELAGTITAILQSRGLLRADLNAGVTAAIQRGTGIDTASGKANGFQMAGSATVNPIYVDPVLGWIPFPSSDLANTNTTVDPCEMILIYPKIVNNTATIGLSSGGPYASAIYDIQVELAGTTGFRVYTNPKTGKLVDNIPRGKPDSSIPESSLPVRLLGWLDPGQDSQTLLGDTNSVWYKALGHSVFSQHLSTTHFPTGVGFLVQAPSDASVAPTAYMKVSYRIYNSADGVVPLSSATTANPYIRVNNALLQIPVSSTSGVSFCSSGT